MDFLKNLFTPKQNTTTQTPKTTFNSFVSQYNKPKQTSTAISFQPNATTFQDAPMSTNYGMSRVDTNKIANTPTNSNQLKSTELEYNFQPERTNAQDTLSRATEGVFGSSTATSTPITTSTRDKTMQSYLDLITKQGTQAEKTLALQDEQKLAEKQEQLRATNEKAMRVKREYENQLRALEKNPEGVFGGALNTQANNLRRQANQELADIAIEQLAAQGNVDTANTIIQQKIDAEFEPIKNQISALKEYYSMNQNDLTDSEKIMLESHIKMQEDQYNSQVENAQLSNQASVYQTMLDNGTITIDKVPEKVLGYMNTQGYVSPEQKTAKEQATGLLTSIDQFMQLGATGAVGPAASKILPALLSTVGIGNYQADKSLVQNIKAQLTLGNLKFLKGAMSDKDLAFIQQASSSLNENMTESQFKKELIKIQGTIVNGMINSPAFSPEEKKTALTKQFLMEDPKATDEQIAEMVNMALPSQQSFNSAGNASASKIANAIKQVESQGNYSAKGASGEFGAYQFMPSTWKQWAGEFLGDSNAQPTPQNQDFVAQAKINSLVQQGYNPEEIALIWNGGTPKRKAGVNKFGVKYDSGAYADKVIKTLYS